MTHVTKVLQSPMNKFSIYAWPAYSTKKLNPYTYLIYKHIEEQGYLVQDVYLGNVKMSIKYMLKVAFSSKCKIFHIHWPSSNILKGRSAFIAWRQLTLFFVAIKLIRLSGKKIVWTVHELEDHESRYPHIKRLIDKTLFENVDGFISMNKRVAEVVKERIKRRDKQRVVLIDHPHYKGHYLNTLTRIEARAKLNIKNEVFVFLFIGQIREYKNVPALIASFKALNNENTLLLIAGRPKTEAVLASIKNEIDGSTRIKLYNTFVKDDDLQNFINACDLVVTPYKRIFNSGSVFLNLSFGKPTLGPDMYALSELKDDLGRRWVKTYKGTLTPEVLEQAMEEVKQENRNKIDPNLDRYAPEQIAKETIAFYQSLL